MEPEQAGFLLPLALFFTFIFAPACIATAFYFMHKLEPHDHDERSH